MAENKNDLNFDFTLGDQPLIPPGQYEVGFVRAEKKFMWKGNKLFLWFQITTPRNYSGVQLYMACPLPTGKKAKVTSKLGRIWVLALGKKPDRFDRFSSTVFRGKYFLANVRTVTQSANQTKLIPELQYSIIQELLERIAG